MKSLLELYREHQGKVTDKWSIYLSEYDRLFSVYRDMPVSLLEIGRQSGGSLEIWRGYFHNAQVLVGCDINPACARLVYGDSLINVVGGDANVDSTEAEILRHSPSFDLIIDDGAKTAGDFVKSFSRYFRRLNEGGIYVVKDLYCSHRQDSDGRLCSANSSIAFFKRLADVINHEHWVIEKRRKELLRGFSERFSMEFDECDLAEIQRIEFFKSVCAIHKWKRQSNEIGEHFVIGQSDTVVADRAGFLGQTLTPPRSGNTSGGRGATLGEEAKKLSKVVSDRERPIMGLALDVEAPRNLTNWRVTKPFRFVGHQVARGIHLFRIASTVLKMGGGIRVTLKKALRIFQRDGLTGLKRGIRIVQRVSEVRLADGLVGVDRNDYVEWVRRYDSIDGAKRAKLRARCRGLSRKPKISVVMPTYNPKSEWLIEVIESVKSQIYTNWELCIADDASSDPAVRLILERYAREDERIKVVFRTQNGHISAASNSALELATGEWVALLDHDDLLTEHALALVAEAINRYPSAGLIYSDEDKIDEGGVRSAPYFKCEWNIDIFRSQNMICHLGAYRCDLIKTVGGFREGFEGSQDYDLALRIVERLPRNNIIHIPHVLYHWRIHAESTASNAATKTYAQDSGIRALQEHFQRMAIEATVELTDFLQYQVRYPIPFPQPKISLIVPTRNGLNLLRQCLDSIFTKTTYQHYEVLIIDNGSDDVETLDYLNKVNGTQNVRVIRDDSPFNYSALNNRAVLSAEGEYVGLLNNDVEVITPEWLDEMLSLAARVGTGAVGASLWYADESLQHGGVITGIGRVAGHSHKNLPRGTLGYFGRAGLTHGLSAVTAACLVIKKSTYLEVGGLDETNLQVAFNDVDFCLRVREAGYQNVWTPFAELYHHESATRGFEDTPEKLERFAKEIDYMERTWGESLLNDPAYSPNLTLDHEDFSLAWPPRVGLFK